MDYLTTPYPIQRLTVGLVNNEQERMRKKAVVTQFQISWYVPGVAGKNQETPVTIARFRV
jgi:hypothetical protein